MEGRVAELAWEEIRSSSLASAWVVGVTLAETNEGDCSGIDEEGDLRRLSLRGAVS